jgi:hypothetical protein
VVARLDFDGVLSFLIFSRDASFTNLSLLDGLETIPSRRDSELRLLGADCCASKNSDAAVLGVFDIRASKSFEADDFLEGDSFSLSLDALSFGADFDFFRARSSDSAIRLFDK